MDGFAKAINSAKAYLETDKMAGVEALFRESAKSETGQTKDVRLEALKKSAEACKGCQLNKRRTNLVFGVGTPSAKLMFIGEAPGEDEDLKGEPFVGRAGQLLTKMIEAMGLRREDVYIANILKCRPPNNRPPQPDEISACCAFIAEQVKIINPKVVCALGKFAAQFLLKTDEPISALRGKFRGIDLADGVKVMPTFHPAYMLRNPSSKRLVWEDLKKIKNEID
ncbi:MAG: uracil-DNA glycosylase [Candidatus Omnitrophica bacterium]|nr:uracil-DNA glycosylase [Candidatus Omnitrophota bacterium]